MVTQVDRLDYIQFEADLRNTEWKGPPRSIPEHEADVARDFDSLPSVWRQKLIDDRRAIGQAMDAHTDATNTLAESAGHPLGTYTTPAVVFGDQEWNDPLVFQNFVHLFGELAGTLSQLAWSITLLMDTLRDLPSPTYSRKLALDSLAQTMQEAQDSFDLAEHYVKTLRAFLPSVIKTVLSPQDELDNLADRQESALLGAAWIGEWQLGAGSFGEANLWVKQGANSRVIDRVVIKTAKVPAGAWEKRTPAKDRGSFWRHSSDGSAIPNEVAAMYALRDLTGAERSIVRTRNWIPMWDQASYRIYMEFCPHGDLHKWSRWYSDAQVYPYKHALRDTGVLVPPFVPEPFVWHTLECLATAGLLMAQGTLDNGRRPGWESIIHFDMKTSNTFLGVPSADRYRGYPTPKVGDFGLCTLVASDDTRVVGDFDNAGTPGNKAVEVSKPWRVNSALPSEKTNVWAAGITGWSIIEGEEGDHRLQYDDFFQNRMHDGDFRTLDAPDFRAHSQARYSSELRNLITWMTAYNPTDRPNFRQVLDIIQLNTGRKDQPRSDRSGGLYAADPLDPEFKVDMKLKKDFSAIGTDMASVLPSGLTHTPPPPSDDGSGTEDVNGDLKLVGKPSPGLPSPSFGGPVPAASPGASKSAKGGAGPERGDSLSGAIEKLRTLTIRNGGPTTRSRSAKSPSPTGTNASSPPSPVVKGEKKSDPSPTQAKGEKKKDGPPTPTPATGEGEGEGQEDGPPKPGSRKRSGGFEGPPQPTKRRGEKRWSM